MAVAVAGPSVFAANESLVSPQFDLIDPEYSQSRARLTWVDSLGQLWIAGIDRDTGAFVPADGKGLLIDAHAMSTADLRIIGNGPEWLTAATTEQIVYTKFVPGKPRNRANARLAIAAQSNSGAWSFRLLSDLPRNAPYASKDPGDTSPRITYVDPAGNHYWRQVANPASEQLVPWYPPSYRSMRFVRGARAVVFVAPVSGVSQVHRYWLDTQLLEQITFDDGNKDLNSVPWMWQAPEFGNDFLLSTIVNDRELRVYRLLGGEGGNPKAWSVIYRASEPGNGVLSSPEPFTHNGKSYIYLSAAVRPSNFQSAIFLSNVNSARPLFRRLTPRSTLRARMDPEVFVTSQGPFIYFNRFDPALAGPGQPPNCWACSEGIFRANTGLGPAVPN